MYNRQNCRALNNKSLHGVSVPKCWTKKKKKGSTPCIIRLKIQNPNWSCKMGSNVHREKQRRQQIMFSVGKWRLVCDLLNCKLSWAVGLGGKKLPGQSSVRTWMFSSSCSNGWISHVLYILFLFTAVVDESQGLAFSELGDQGKRWVSEVPGNLGWRGWFAWRAIRGEWH